MLDTSIQVIPEGNEHHGMSYLGIRLIYIWRSMLDPSIQVIPKGNEHHGMSYLGIRLFYIWRPILDPNIHNTKVLTSD